MGLLDNISKASNSLSSKLGGISDNINGFSNIARGALCLPTLISGAFNAIPGMINNLVSGIGNILAGSASSLINNAIQGAVGDAVNKINGKISAFNNAVSSISNTINSIKSTIDNLQSQTLDILNFIPSKDNCQFAAAELNKCVTKQAVSSISNKQLRDVAAGVIDIGTITNGINKSVSSATGPIVGIANKQVKQLNRAVTVVKKAGKII